MGKWHDVYEARRRAFQDLAETVREEIQAIESAMARAPEAATPGLRRRVDRLADELAEMVGEETLPHRGLRTAPC